MSDIFRKKLLYRSTHRGCKEMDIILGHFAESELSSLSHDEVFAYEELLSLSDEILYSKLSKMIVGSEATSEQQDYLAVRIAKFYRK